MQASSEKPPRPSKATESGRLLTVRAASALSGLSPQDIRDLCRSGELRAFKRSRGFPAPRLASSTWWRRVWWLVPASSLEAWYQREVERQRAYGLTTRGCPPEVRRAYWRLKQRESRERQRRGERRGRDWLRRLDPAAWPEALRRGGEVLDPAPAVTRGPAAPGGPDDPASSGWVGDGWWNGAPPDRLVGR